MRSISGVKLRSMLMKCKRGIMMRPHRSPGVRDSRECPYDIQTGMIRRFGVYLCKLLSVVLRFEIYNDRIGSLG